jgi:hypothetical protein
LGMEMANATAGVKVFSLEGFEGGGKVPKRGARPKALFHPGWGVYDPWVPSANAGRARRTAGGCRHVPKSGML